MSSRDVSRGRAGGFRPARFAFLCVAGALALSVGGCFTPLYGPTATGTPLASALAAIDVAPVQAPARHQEISHHVRSELIFQLDGSGQPSPKRYRLEVSIAQSVQTPIVDTQTGRANSATIVLDGTYRLIGPDGKRLVAEGKATASATYDRTIQRFATVRAARDAEIRASTVLAEQIKNRVAIALRADPVAQ